jgi:ferric-dicitrate binding protein FerR (iron transport regulator)
MLKRDWKTNRNLTLKGEAYFKVKEEFTVNTAIGEVTCSWTQFNVKGKNS